MFEDEDKKKDDKKDEFKDKKEESSEIGMQQAVAAIGVALIAMGEDNGAELSLRNFKHPVSSISTNKGFFFGIFVQFQVPYGDPPLH